MGVLYRDDDVSMLRRSVNSILNQTWGNYEFLICDDGSALSATLLLDEMAERDRRIRLIRPGGKINLASKLNTCMGVASGEYYMRMDDDDYSRPDRLEKQLQALRTHTDIAFIGSNARLIRCGTICGKRELPEFPCIRDFYMTQPFIHPSLLFRREAMEAVGGYSENPHQYLCEDYDLLLRMYAEGFCGMNLQEPLLDYTIPSTAKGSRTMRDRWNETVTRWERFRKLDELPYALPYVLKPLVVGMIPEPVLKMMKYGIN